MWLLFGAGLVLLGLAFSSSMKPMDKGNGKPTGPTPGTGKPPTVTEFGKPYVILETEDGSVRGEATTIPSTRWRVFKPTGNRDMTEAAAAETIFQQSSDETANMALSSMLSVFAEQSSGKEVIGSFNADRPEVMGGWVPFSVELVAIAPGSETWGWTTNEGLMGSEPQRGLAILAAVNAARFGSQQGGGFTPEPPHPDLQIPATPVPNRTMMDGNREIRFFRKNGEWTWDASVAADQFPTASEQGFTSFNEARLDAWNALRSLDVGPIVAAPVTRNGLQLQPDAELVVADPLIWGMFAQPILAIEWAKGERDAGTLMFAPLARTFTNVNPFRFGGLAPGHFQSAINKQEASPTSSLGDDLARAMFEIVKDPMNGYTFRGHVIRLRFAPSPVQPGQSVWQYSIDGGAWKGSYATQAAGQAAAEAA